MSLAGKLNLKPGMKVRVMGKPTRVDLDDVTTTTSAGADGVLAFVKTTAEVDARVRQVAIDDVWSAMRFRPGN